MRFEQEIVVPAPQASVWQALWNVEEISRCIPGCEEVRVLEAGKRYAARMTERVGPFRARFDLEITVGEAVEPSLLKATVVGKDSALASSLRVNLEVGLEADGEAATRLHLVSDVAILGRLGTLGHSIIKRKADEAVEKFGEALRLLLAGRAG